MKTILLNTSITVSFFLVDSFLSIRFYGRIADACSANASATAYYYKYTMPAFNMVIPYSTVTFIIMQVMQLPTYILYFDRDVKKNPLKELF